MASLGMLIGGAAVNALAFSGSNFLFGQLNKRKADEERERHDRAVEQLSAARAQWSETRTRKLDFYNRYLQEQHLATAEIIDINDAARQYYLATKQTPQSLKREPTLSDFYHPSQDQKSMEISFIIVGLGGLSYLIYKYL